MAWMHSMGPLVSLLYTAVVWSGPDQAPAYGLDHQGCPVCDCTEHGGHWGLHRSRSSPRVVLEEQGEHVISTRVLLMSMLGSSNAFQELMRFIVDNLTGFRTVPGRSQGQAIPPSNQTQTQNPMFDG